MTHIMLGRQYHMPLQHPAKMHHCSHGSIQPLHCLIHACCQPTIGMSHACLAMSCTTHLRCLDAWTLQVGCMRTAHNTGAYVQGQLKVGVWYGREPLLWKGAPSAMCGRCPLGWPASRRCTLIWMLPRPRSQPCTSTLGRCAW